MRCPEAGPVSTNHGVENMKFAPEIRKLARSLVVLAMILSSMLYTAPAHAQIQAWVSHNGLGFRTTVMAPIFAPPLNPA
jgi:hypothetical protein